MSTAILPQSFPQHTERPTRILIVDDEFQTTRLLEFILRRAGYLTATAHDGLQGVKTAGQFRPDAILLDVQMPEMSGLEVLRVLREDDAFADTVVLVLTASSFELPPEELLAAGANAHCSKPIAPSSLLRKLQELGMSPSLPLPAPE